MKASSILFIITCLVLAACDASQPYTDPYAIENAQATLTFAKAQTADAIQAIQDANATATIAAAQTQRASDAEIRVIEARIAEINAGVNATQTLDARAAATEEAIINATAQAVGTATAIARTATPVAATQIAIGNQMKLEDDRQKTRLVSMWAWALVPPAMIIVLFIFLLLSGKEIFEWWVNERKFAARLQERREGLFIFNFDPQLKDWVAQMIAPRQQLAAGFATPIRSQKPPEVINLTPSGSVLSSPMHQRRVSARWAVELLYDAAEIDENATNIPGWRDLPGWSSGRWQEGVGYWELVGVAKAQPGSGTTITHPDFHTIGELLYALETKKIQLRPTMKADNRDAKSRR